MQMQSAKLSMSKSRSRMVSQLRTRDVRSAHGRTWLEFLLGRSVIAVFAPPPPPLCNMAEYRWRVCKWLNAANYYKSTEADAALATTACANEAKLREWKSYRSPLIAQDAMRRFKVEESENLNPPELHSSRRRSRTLLGRLPDQVDNKIKSVINVL